MEEQLLAPLAAVSMIGVWFVVCEIAARFAAGAEVELFRKAAHIGGTVLAAGSLLWVEVIDYVLIGLAFAVVMAVLPRFVPLQAMSERVSAGPIAYGLGVACAALVAPNAAIFGAALLILGLADTAAVVIGKRWPLRRLRSGKSVGGGLGFWLIAAVLLAGVGTVAWPLALAVAVLLALVELATPGGWDNLSVPAAVAALGWLMV